MSPACAPRGKERRRLDHQRPEDLDLGAHYSDYGLLIKRTDPNVPKHKGLTMFFLDMKSPGVEVKPIKQANGMQEFNEVYFTDVVIPIISASARSATAGTCR